MGIERAVKRALEPFPGVKRAVNRAVQIVGYALARDKVVCEGDVRRVTPQDGFEYFFGYYDKSPWDIDDARMLCLRVKDARRSPAPREPGELVLIDTEHDNRIIPIATTRTWNVQQGCMAQWLGPDFRRYVLYNDFRDGGYRAVIFDTLLMREARVLPMAVYDAAKDGSFGLSLDFSRLHRLRPGYGYSNLPEATAGEKCPDAPCIWRVDLVTGAVKPLMKYTDFARFEPDPSMDGAEHKVNHLMLSPDGRRFMVLHRWFQNGHKHTRLVTVNADGTGMYNLSDDGFVSHCYWKNSAEIIAFLNKAETGEHYYLMRDGSREYSLLWPPLKRDGHCSYAPDGRLVVTDCYPNRARVASVYLCDPEANVAGVLARVHSPLKYHADCRCDLHPRWNRRGDMLCIDSVHEGKRGLYVIPVDEEALAHPVAVKAGRRSLKGMLKRNKVLYHVTRTLKKAPEPFYKLYMLWCHRRYGVQPNTAFFTSYDGTLYNDNPRAVAEALHALSPDTRIQFRLNARGRRLPLPDWLEPLPRMSRQTLRALATAKVIVTNSGMQNWMVKFDDQFYVQTWHGDRGFKKIRLDIDPNHKYFRLEGPRIDLAVSGSTFGSGVYRTGMGAKKEILEVGCPRNDLLVQNPPETARRVRERLGIAEETRVLLYAPTFRAADTGGRQDAGLSLERVRATLEEATGEKWLCVTRSHEVARGIASDARMDLSAYPEPSELLLITDLLITDYSSIGGDFMLLDRPVIYYQPDRGDYDAERGGLYFDPDQSPLLVAHDEEELMRLLKSPIDAHANCRACLDFFGCRETGRAAQRVAERIAERLA